MAKIRHCIVCNSEYQYCPHCSGYNSNEKWRMIYCSENCREIYHVYDAFNAGSISAEDAKNKLSNCDLKANGSYTSFVQEGMNRIYNNVITVDEPTAIEETVIEEEPIVDSEEVVVDEPRFKRNKRNRRNFVNEGFDYENPTLIEE